LHRRLRHSASALRLHAERAVAVDRAHQPGADRRRHRQVQLHAAAAGARRPGDAADGAPRNRHLLLGRPAGRTFDRETNLKTALITGASSGLGRGLAVAFAQRGVKVYAAARREAELTTLAKETPNIEPMVLDVSDADATFEVVQKLDAKDPLDLVIANAGIGRPTPGTD